MPESILTNLQEIIDKQHQAFDNLELKKNLKEILHQLDPGPDSTCFVPPTEPDSFHVRKYTKKMVAPSSKKKSRDASIIHTGFQQLDRLMRGGFESGELIILGGRPGMGKTTLLLSLIRNILSKFKKPVYYLSTDDVAASILKRLHAMISGVNTTALAEEPDESTWDSYIDALKTIEKLPLYIDDTHPAYIERIMDASRWMKTQHGIRLICIENLQSIHTERRFRTRNLELGNICRRLKELTRELNIPILAASHLSRQVEYRGGTKRPLLADLRDSGNIELEADKVLFLYRPEYYNIDVDEVGNSTMQLAELALSKNRTGKTGTILLKRDTEFTRFIDFDKYTEDLNIQSRRLDDLKDDDSTPF